MPNTVAVTEQDLRAAMRDPRYWNASNPERAAFSQWVTEGFQALFPAGNAPKGVVQVRAYMREGRIVAAHTRASTEGGAAPDATRIAGQSRPGDHADADRRRQCDMQAEDDEARCRRLPPANRRARAMCWASVQLRYAACMRGRELPPLQTR
jgi:hypothetical protein